MQIRVFAVPMDGDPEAIEERNRFLRGNRVLSVEKVAVIDHGRHYWSVCVEFLQARTSNSLAPAASNTADSTKPRIDYREILSKDEFSRFARHRYNPNNRNSRRGSRAVPSAPASFSRAIG